MRNAGIHEFLAHGAKARTSIERNCPHLGMQHDCAMTVASGGLDQKLQQHATHSSAAPFRHHRHPADVAIGQQSPGANRPASRLGQGVHAIGVEAIPFELDRHVLLAHENRFSNRAQGNLIPPPVRSANGELEISGHGRPAAHLALQAGNDEFDAALS